MFVLLIWLPIGMLVASVFMIAERQSFAVNNFDDFIDNAAAFLAVALLWPLVIIFYTLHAIYELIYER